MLLGALDSYTRWCWFVIRRSTSELGQVRPPEFSLLKKFASVAICLPAQSRRWAATLGRAWLQARRLRAAIVNKISRGLPTEEHLGNNINVMGCGSTDRVIGPVRRIGLDVTSQKKHYIYLIDR